MPVSDPTDTRSIPYDETTPLIREDNDAEHALQDEPRDESSTAREASDGVSRSLKTRLYASHFLSTWNSRIFEFGAILYLAAIYPGTLLPMSVYALVRGFAAVFLAPAIGQHIDRANRLAVVRL